MAATHAGMDLTVSQIHRKLYAEVQEKPYLQHLQYLLSSMVEAVLRFGDPWMLLALVISLSVMSH